jgi:hypothetical protein
MLINPQLMLLRVNCSFSSFGVQQLILTNERTTKYIIKTNKKHYISSTSNEITLQQNMCSKDGIYAESLVMNAPKVCLLRSQEICSQT